MTNKPLKLIIIAFQESAVKYQVHQTLKDLGTVDVLEAVNAKDLYHKCVDFHPEVIICDSSCFPIEYHYQKKLEEYCQYIFLFADTKHSLPKSVAVKCMPYPPGNQMLREQISLIL
jgi:DNA-binding NarL/FixJ family response regulator